MNAVNGFHGFQLDDELILHQGVNPVAAIQSNSLVLDGQWPLEMEMEAVKLHFPSEALLVRRLQESRSENTVHLVHLNGATDDSVRKFVEFQLRALRDLRGYRAIGYLSSIAGAI